MKTEGSKIFEENGRLSKFVSLQPKQAIICINLLKTVPAEGACGRFFSSIETEHESRGRERIRLLCAHCIGFCQVAYCNMYS
jgi:hypothetical protein